MSFLQQYKNPVGATTQLLKQLGVKVTDTTVNETILSHPDAPSLLSISESLRQWDVENTAVKVDKNQLEEYPFPLLAYTRGQFYVLTDHTPHTISYIDDKGKNHEEVKGGFLNNWDGIGLAVQALPGAGEKDYTIKKKKENQEALIIPVIAGMMLILGAGAAYLFAQVYSAILITGYSLLLLVKLAGVIVTGLLLWYEIDKHNPALQKICSGSSQVSNCSAILGSSKSKLFNIISWSEIGFFYFAGSFLSLLINPALLYTMAWLNVLALPYIIFSLSYQGFVVRQWCRLCVAVQALLLGEFIVSYSSGILRWPLIWGVNTTYYALVCFLLPILIWYFIKPHFLKEQQTKNSGRELLRIKHNPDIFFALLERQRKVVLPDPQLGIIIGNPNAKNTILKVCNPFCAPCARAHKEIDELLEINDNIRVQIIFTDLKSRDEKMVQPARHLLAIAEKADNQLIAKALDDWYLSDKKEYPLFAAKYPLNGEINRQENKLQSMANWCKETKISYTPTLFINGYQLPAMYAPEDLKYLLVNL